MADSAVLPYSTLTSANVKKAENKGIFDELRSYFKDWHRWNMDKTIKLAPLKLYIHFKNHEFCDVLNLLGKLEDKDFINEIKDYIKKANAPKFYSVLFKLKENIKRFFGEETECNILEKKLEEAAKTAYSSYSPLLNEKEQRYSITKKKNFRDLEDREKYYLINQRIKGVSAYDLAIRRNLSDRKVVYRVMTGYNKQRKKQHISQICNMLNKNSYNAEEIFGMVNKVRRRTFGRLSADKAMEISALNKEGKIKAEELVKLHNLSGRHVVYLSNKYRREREQREKAKEIAMQEAKTQQPIMQQTGILVESSITDYPAVSDYLH